MKNRFRTVMYVVLSVVLCSGCVKQGGMVSEKEIDWSISKHSDVTGMDYEEGVNGVKAAFLTFEDKDFIIEEVQNWANIKSTDHTYDTYIHSDPDSWEAYVYYAGEDTNVSYDCMKFYMEDATVKVCITSSDAAAQPHSSYFLILIQAPSKGVWPKDVDVYIDDVQLEKRNFDVSVWNKGGMANRENECSHLTEKENQRLLIFDEGGTKL